MQRNDEIVTISMEEKNLTQNLQEFKSKNDFKKYASVSVILLLCCELILGFCFNTFFSEIMEQKRKPQKFLFKKQKKFMEINTIILLLIIKTPRRK